MTRLQVSWSELECSMDDARHGPRVARTQDGDLDVGTRRRLDVEPPERGSGHVGGDGAIARREHRGKDPLITGPGVCRMA